MLGEPRLFEAVRAIIDTCMEARMVREASMVLKQVMKRYAHTLRAYDRFPKTYDQIQRRTTEDRQVLMKHLHVALLSPLPRSSLLILPLTGRSC
jgi:hypothetical protein